MSLISRSLLIAASFGLASAAQGQSLQAGELSLDLEEAAAREARGEVQEEAPQPPQPPQPQPQAEPQAQPQPPQPAPGQTSRPVLPVQAENFSLAAVARAEDVRSLDAIVTAFYDIVSGPAGEKRDWNRFRGLFYAGGRMIPTGPNNRTGKVGALVASPDAYIKANEGFLLEGFHQTELSRHVDSFGALAQVFSWYEVRLKPDDAKAFQRGVNSLQLLNDGQRWWILSVAWTPETATNPLPAEVSRRLGR